MFGSIGGPELILIAVLALLLFGPRKLPQIGRSVGKALAEFRSVTSDFKSSLEREVELEEVQQTATELNSVSRQINAEVGQATKAVSGRPARNEDAPPASIRDGSDPYRS